jgi:hypothetical protein
MHGRGSWEWPRTNARVDELAVGFDRDTEATFLGRFGAHIDGAQRALADEILKMVSGEQQELGDLDWVDGPASGEIQTRKDDGAFGVDDCRPRASPGDKCAVGVNGDSNRTPAQTFWSLCPGTKRTVCDQVEDVLGRHCEPLGDLRYDERRAPWEIEARKREAWLNDNHCAIWVGEKFSVSDD